MDTIIAPATPSGESALALLRISGPESGDLLQAFSGKPLAETDHRKARLLPYRASDGRILDHLVATFFPEGSSFTGEAMVELTPHGSPFIVQKILEDLLARGCRLAEHGEFSRRAFLNGKLDLSQAEAIVDLIRARSERALEAARRQLSGSVGITVNGFVDRLLAVTAQLEAYIDFPEEDLPPEDEDGPAKSLKTLIADMEKLIATSHYQSLLHDGIKTVILGEPNAGKSSLLNALTGEDRVIVSAEPGTTRDYIEERIHVGPYLLRIIDTAGLHDTASDIEQQGISRSLQQIQSADMLIVVLDSTRPLPSLPDQVLQGLRDNRTIIVENKSDLANNPKLAALLPKAPHLPICATSGNGLPKLRQVLREMIESGVVVPNEDAVIVSARHADALANAKNALQEALRMLRNQEAGELVAAHLREAVDHMGHITGKIDNETMLDQLFQNFCIGK